MKRFEGKTVWVTGAAKGIGLAAVEEFLAEGATVAATDVDAAALEENLAGRDNVHTFVQDVTDRSRWDEVAAEIVATCGGVDVLVNNAGIGTLSKITDTTDDLWRKTMAVNLDSVFYGVQTGISVMREKGGSIVNVASIAGNVAEPNLAAYSATKGGVRLLTKTAAVECARDGIPVRINSLHPGWTETPLVNNAIAELGDQAEAFAGAVIGAVPAGRLATPKEIARPLVFLASDDASFMVGSELIVDGGYTAV